MSFSLLPHPWGTLLKMRASETSSGRGIPGDQDLLLLSWGYVEGDLNLAILGRMPELHICSDLKPEPKITGRRSTQATPAGERRETGHRASWPTGPGQGRPQNDPARGPCSPADPTSARLKVSFSWFMQLSVFRKTTLGCQFSFLRSPGDVLNLV